LIINYQNKRKLSIIGMKTKNESRDEECYAKALILSGCPKLSNISAIASLFVL